MEEINIKDFLNYYRRYVVLVIMVVALCVLVTILYDKILKKPMYSTYTTVVLVKNEKSDSDDALTLNDVNLSQKLVSTYREIITSRLVLGQVINELNLDYSINKIMKEIDVTAKSDTEILKITVTDKDPNLASRIANVVADVFDREITQIYNISNVSIIDRALVPTNPSNMHLMRDIVLVMLASFVGVSAVIFIIFYFDDTLRSVEEIEGEVGLPLVAKVYKDNTGVDLIVEKKPNAIVSESIRTLRTNLQFSAVDSDLKTILVTSSVPAEGKSFITANLAIAFAQTGKKVLIVDCDLRKGRQHKIFGVAGKNGLSNLLIGDITKSKEYIVQTKVENLSLIPRGIFPPNPSELLNSKKNASLIKLLGKYYDIIILDGTPIVGLSDSLILSSLVDKVLVVSAVGHTPKTELKNAKKSLENVNANVAGCIANNISAARRGYGSYYYYYGDKE